MGPAEGARRERQSRHRDAVVMTPANTAGSALCHTLGVLLCFWFIALLCFCSNNEASEEEPCLYFLTDEKTVAPKASVRMPSVEPALDHTIVTACVNSSHLPWRVGSLAFCAALSLPGIGELSGELSKSLPSTHG